MLFPLIRQLLNNLPFSDCHLAVTTYSMIAHTMKRSYESLMVCKPFVQSKVLRVKY